MTGKAIREALEPFAKAAERVSDRHHDHNRIRSFTAISAGLTVGDLRRARTAYDAIGSEPAIAVPRKIMQAIAEGYNTRGREDRFVIVTNPDFLEDNGEDPDLVFDLSTHTAAGARPVGEVVARQHDEGWQPIETAPTGGKFGCFLMLAFGPPGDQTVSEGMHFQGRFYAASVFYTGGPHDTKQFTFREHEVKPTHWRHKLAAPGAARPVGEPGEVASVWKVEQLAEQICLGGYPEDMRRELEERKNPTYWLGLPEKTREQHRRSARTVMALYARPVKEPGEVERQRGWIYFNPDAGTEWAENHPVESGEVPDAEDIRPGIAEELLKQLIPAWRELATETSRRETAEAALAESEQNAQGLASDLAGTQAELAETRERLEKEAPKWRPIEERDQIVETIQTFGEVTLRNSHPVWVRDADGRVYEAVWTVNGKGRGYWWDTEGESPVDPVAILPHPLTERAALTGDAQEGGK